MKLLKHLVLWCESAKQFKTVSILQLPLRSSVDNQHHFAFESAEVEICTIQGLGRKAVEFRFVRHDVGNVELFLLYHAECLSELLPVPRLGFH